MTNLKFLKTLTAGAILTLATCPQSWACEDGYVKGVTTGKCIPASGNCGDGCAYTIDSQGNLDITGNGTGIVSDWKFRGNKDIVNVNITGISKIGGYAFSQAGSNNGTVTISESLRSAGMDSFAGSGFSKIDINSTNFEARVSSFQIENITMILPASENITLQWATFGNSASVAVDNVNIICKGDVLICRKQFASAINTVRNDNGTVNLSDEQGKSIVYDDSGFSLFDENNDILAKYNKSGGLLSQYTYNDDGSVSITDANGKLTGLKNAKYITPAQAAALIKKCNCNTVKLKFK